MGVVAATQNVVAVRFHAIGKLYHFDISPYPDLEPSDYVIVETARGRQIGQIMGTVAPEKVNSETIKPIIAPATARELMLKKLWEAKELEALIACREAAAGIHELKGVKWVKAEYNYDGSTLAFLYTTEDDENVNTNKLRHKLESQFHSRLDLRRIGARDAARFLGEYGACGAPRCCATHLTEFSPVTIKMAKMQGISLNPAEITGMCGRLRCCLVYEYEQYVEALKQLPKVNKMIGTPFGEGKVIHVNALADSVTVVVEESRHEVKRDEIQPLEEFRALKEKAAQGCTKEGLGGPCECGGRVRSGIPATPEASQQQQPERQQRPERRREPDRPRTDRPPQQRAERPAAQAAAPSEKPEGDQTIKRNKRRRGRRRRGGGGGQKPNPQGQSGV
jgi:cell fate regulator YaaT (PSP1 superfamily)